MRTHTRDAGMGFSWVHVQVWKKIPTGYLYNSLLFTPLVILIFDQLVLDKIQGSVLIQ
jgi:hypothetical protein